MPDLPSGTITFLFTDIEGSTRLWERQPAAMEAAMARHNAILQEAITSRSGHIFRGEGDAIFAAFAIAPQAVAAAVAAQRALYSEPWPVDEPLRVRMAIHTGQVQVVDGDYTGSSLNRLGRLLDVCHGGQIIMSQATHQLVRDQAPAVSAGSLGSGPTGWAAQGVEFLDLGQHRLRDLVYPEQIFQVVIDGLPAEFPPLLTLEATSSHLPSQLTTFVGRERELVEVKNLVASARLITITGPGGSGKSRLAIEVASQMLRVFPDGVHFVPLEPIDQPQFMVSAIGDALQLSFAGQADPLQQLLTHLRPRTLLLVLDNFEHIMDGADLVMETLRAAPRVKLLVTSREVLNLAEEWIYALGGLECPTSRDAEDLERYSAIQLFLDRARRIRRSFSPDDEHAGMVRICHLVSGLPLALELAASWTRHMDSTAIADEIERNLDFLSSRMRDLPERHRSMRATMDYSWELLTEQEQRVLSWLSVFRGGFRRLAAEEVAGGTLPILTALVDKSLLRWEPSGRYQMHEFVRQYAEEALAREPEAVGQARDAHCNFFARFLDQRWQDMHQHRQQEALREVEAEIDNVRHAWQWAVEQLKSAAIAKAVEPFLMFYDTTGRFHEGATALETALSALEQAPQRRDTSLALASVIVGLGWSYIRLGRLDQAEKTLVRGQQLYADLDQEPPKTFTSDPLTGLGVLANTRGQFVEALRLGEKARQAHEARGDIHNLQLAHYIMAEAAFSQGEYEAAHEHAQKAYTLSEDTGNRWFSSYVLIELGKIARARRGYAEAQQHFQASYDIAQAFGHREGAALALNHLGRIEWLQGHLAEAEAFFKQSLQIYEQLDDRGGLAACLSGLGDAARTRRDLEKACHYYRRALEISQDIGYAPLTLSVCVGIGHLWFQGGQIEAAAELMAAVANHPSSDQETRDSTRTGLERARAALSPERFQALVEAGRAADLDEMTPNLLRALRDLELHGKGAAPADSKLRTDVLIHGDMVPSAIRLQAQPSVQRTAGTGLSRPVPFADEASAFVETLTDRELEVLQLLAAGMANAEIAERLVIAVGTVKSYTANIYGKLGVRNRLQAVVRAQELGLLPSPGSTTSFG